MTTDLDAPIIGVRDRIFAVRPVLGIGEPGRGLGVLDRAVGFQGEQPLAATLGDQASRFDLAMQRVSGDQNAVEVNQAEQRAYGNRLNYWTSSLILQPFPDSMRPSSTTESDSCAGTKPP